MTDIYPCCDPSAGTAFLNNKSLHHPSYASSSSESTICSLDDCPYHAPTPISATLPTPTFSRSTKLLSALETLAPTASLMYDSDSSGDLDFSPDEAEIDSEYESEVSDVEVFEDGEVFHEEVIRVPDTPSSAPAPRPELLNVLNPATPLLPEGDSDVDSDLDYESEHEGEDEDDEDYEADGEGETDTDSDTSDVEIVVDHPAPVNGVKRGAEEMEDSDDEEKGVVKRRRKLEDIPWYCGEDEEEEGEGEEIDCRCGGC